MIRAVCFHAHSKTILKVQPEATYSPVARPDMMQEKKANMSWFNAAKKEVYKMHFDSSAGVAKACPNGLFRPTTVS